MADEVQPVKLGIENLKKVLKIAAGVGSVADKIGHNAKAGVAKWMALTELFDEAMMLQGLDMKAVMPEVKDLDAAERGELYLAVKGDLDLADDQLEAAIEEGVAILVDAAAIVDRAIVLSKKFKKA